eukprot:2836075-Rhodomonas_salina.2
MQRQRRGREFDLHAAALIEDNMDGGLSSDVAARNCGVVCQLPPLEHWHPLLCARYPVRVLHLALQHPDGVRGVDAECAGPSGCHAHENLDARCHFRLRVKGVCHILNLRSRFHID